MNKLQNMKYLTTHTYQPTKQSLLWPHAVFSTLSMVREIKSTQIEVIIFYALVIRAGTPMLRNGKERYESLLLIK